MGTAGAAAPPQEQWGSRQTVFRLKMRRSIRYFFIKKIPLRGKIVALLYTVKADP